MAVASALGGNWFLSLGILKKNDVKHRVDEDVKMVSKNQKLENKITKDMDDDALKRTRRGSAGKENSTERPVAFSRRRGNPESY